MSYPEWIADLQWDKTALGEGSKAYQRFMVQPSPGISTAPVKRAESFLTVKYKYPLAPVGYHLGVCRATHSDGNSYIYGQIYWPRGRDEPEYVCISPTFDSRDGEFRRSLLWYPQFDRDYMELSDDTFSPLEEHILETVGRGELELDTAYFGGSCGPGCARFADEARIAIRMYATTLYLQCLQLCKGGGQAHMNASFRKGVTAMCSGFTPPETRAKKWQHFLLGAPTASATGVGVKLIPTTIRAVAEYPSIVNEVSRELWIGEIASDLVLNGRAYGFPIQGGASLLDGIGPGAFDNAAMAELFGRSEQAWAVIAKTRALRAELEGKPLTTTFRGRQLDARLLEAIEYAQTHLALTDVVQCNVTEFVGRTWGSFASSFCSRAFESDVVASLLAAGPAWVARQAFDLCYAAHALHDAGFVHGDLHINNMTIRRVVSMYDPTTARPGRPHVRNPVVAFVTGERGEADTYLLPHDGYASYVVDFSRAVAGPAGRARAAADFGDELATRFYREQAPRALRVLNHYAPRVVERNEEALKGAYFADPEGFFWALSAVDFLAVGRNLGAHLRRFARASEDPAAKAADGAFGVAAAALALLERLERRSLEALVAALSDLVAGGRPVAQAPPRPAATIFADVFADFRFARWAEGSAPLPPGFDGAPGVVPDDYAAAAPSPKPRGRVPTPAGLEGPSPPLKDLTLVDIFSVRAKMRYSGARHETYPPWAREEDALPRLAGLDPARVFGERGEGALVAAEALDPLFEALKERLRAEADQDPEGAQTSSWIA